MLGTASFVGFPIPATGDDVVQVPLAGLTLWLDATRGVTLDGATSRITAWASRAGGGPASQATTAAMPTVALMNGRPSVSFDGADDALFVANPPTVGDLSTAFCVFQVGSEVTYRSPFGGSAGGALELNVTSGFKVRTRLSSGVDIATSLNNAVSAGQPALVSTTFDRNGGTNGPVTLRINRVAVAPTTRSVSAFSTATDRIGTTVTGDRMNGLVSEVLLYGRILSAAEIAQVEAYLSAKWGIA